MKIRILFSIVLFLLVFLSCEKDNDKNIDVENGDPTTEIPELTDYLPLENGNSWQYRVNFPDRVYVPYNPIIESPEHVIYASGICRKKSWNAGDIYFDINVNNKKISSANSTTWGISLNSTGREFYFGISGDATTELRVTTEDSTAQFDLVATSYLNNSSISGTGELSLSQLMDYMSHNYTFRYKLAYITEDDLSNKYTVTVPGDTFENCIKSVVNIKGDGQYVSSGTYPVETYLAPNFGIVKVIGKDKDGTVLYTLEKTDSLYIDDNNGDNNDDICMPFDTECGTCYVCCSDSFCNEFYYLYNGKKYICETDSCTEAIDELMKDMCGF